MRIRRFDSLDPSDLSNWQMDVSRAEMCLVLDALEAYRAHHDRCAYEQDTGANMGIGGFHASEAVTHRGARDMAVELINMLRKVYP